MASTIRQLAAQVRRIINKGDVSDDYQFGERETMMLLRQHGYRMLDQIWYENRNQGQKSIDSHFIVPFEKPVLKDTKYFYNYTDVPVEYMSLPDNSGIYSVRPMPSKTNEDPIAMIPIQPLDMDVFRNLPAGALEQQWCYEVQRSRIIFRKKSGKTLIEKGIENVVVHVATLDPYVVGEDDIFPVPPEKHLELIQGALQLMGFTEQTIKDMILNANPNIMTSETQS